MSSPTFVVIASKKDPAGMNIVEHLRALRFSHPIHLVDTDIIHAENLHEKITADVFIFASRHVSKTNTPSLTFHSIGNWGAAAYGGVAGKLCPSLPQLIKQAYRYLSTHNTLNYAIALEATHHGPYCAKPSIFIEIGCTETEWNNPEAGRIIAECIVHLVSSSPSSFPVLLGIGGTHINASFMKVLERTEYTFAHVCAKYNLEHLTAEQIAAVVAEYHATVLLDWKGLGTEKERIKTLLDTIGISYLRTDKVEFMRTY